MVKQQQKQPPKKLSNLKKAVKLEAALIKARHEAEYKWFKTGKGMLTAVKDQLVQAGKNLNILDVAAMAAGTYLIHELILTSPELSDRAMRFTLSSAALGFTGILYQYAHQLNILPWDKYVAPEKLKDHPAYWLIAFFVSFLMVRHGGQLLGLMKEGAGSLTAVIGAMIA